MSATLHELAGLREVIDATVAENEGELTPELEAQLDAWDGSFADKVERCGLWAVEQLSYAVAIGAEEQRLAKKRRAHENRAEWMKRYLQSCMERAGKTKVNGVLCTVALQKNRASVQPIVPLADEDLRTIATFAPKYVRHEESWSLDKEAILEDHKAGTLDADVAKRVQVVQTQSLRIR